jgi:hypothetical protein
MGSVITSALSASVKPAGDRAQAAPCSDGYADWVVCSPSAWPAALLCAREDQVRASLKADLLRDIFGNPFRPVRLAQARLTTDVVALARAAYEERLLPRCELDGVRLAVLADALEEAGCSDQAILDHLRGPGPHVRGFAIDAMVGKR